MSETGKGLAGAASGSRRDAATLSMLLCAPIAVIAFGLLPQFYGWLVLGPGYVSELNGTTLAQISVNCAANLVVIIGSLRLKDRLDRKIAGVLSRTALVHGALAFFVLITRTGYSATIMIAASAMSATLGCIFMYSEHRVNRVRAALVGPQDAMAKNLRVQYDRISNPDDDLRGYDVVLMPNIGEVTADWAATVSRAMMAGIPVRQLAEFIEEDQGIVAIEHFDLDHLPVGGLTSYQTRKRLMDIGLVLVTAPITISLLASGYLAVWATMGRPAIFIQDRVGLGGQVFRMFKLRTMRPEASSTAMGTTKTSDSRITPLGYWLRRFRIDELPQLWNVLKGDMSIVGPRPEWAVLSEEYSRSLPVYGYRHLVRPGITGWAQVRSGYASDLEETRTKVGYDLFYIKNLSFSLDIQILVRTIGTLITGWGAR